MINICKVLLTSLVAITMLTGCNRNGSKSTEPVLKNRRVLPPLSFSAPQATNAFNRVVKLVEECTPRDSGTAGGEKAALWLQSQLINEGLATELDRFEDKTPYGIKTFNNVIGTIPGSSDKWIILLSHYDTKSGISHSFQGANDSGSSTGLLLELASAIKRAETHHYNYIFGFMDGEECILAYSDRDGFHGSKHFANQLKQDNTKIKAVILTDMIGDRDLQITIPRNSSKELKLLALKAASASGHRDKIMIGNDIIYDDHQAFLDLKYPAINLIDFQFGSKPGANDYWHTNDDSIDKLSVKSLLITGQIVMELINQIRQ